MKIPVTLFFKSMNFSKCLKFIQISWTFINILILFSIFYEILNSWTFFHLCNFFPNYELFQDVNFFQDHERFFPNFWYFFPISKLVLNSQTLVKFSDFFKKHFFQIFCELSFQIHDLFFIFVNFSQITNYPKAWNFSNSWPFSNWWIFLLKFMNLFFQTYQHLIIELFSDLRFFF